MLSLVEYGKRYCNGVQVRQGVGKRQSPMVSSITDWDNDPQNVFKIIFPIINIFII